jgi:adenylate kinase family enzyme
LPGLFGLSISFVTYLRYKQLEATSFFCYTPFVSPITCVFFGRSGAGKGTQAALLIELLKQKDPNRQTIYVETGKRFRDFIERGEPYTSGRVRQVIDNGGLMPAFFPIWMWSGLIIDELKTGQEHMLLDGVCRRPEEAPVLDSALRFYGREKTLILMIEVHHQSAKDRLLARGRVDDHEQKIAERMRWFENDVLRAVKFFENNSDYRFVRINGDQTIEEVFADVRKAIGI